MVLTASVRDVLDTPSYAGMYRCNNRFCMVAVSKSTLFSEISCSFQINKNYNLFDSGFYLNYHCSDTEI
jgi:hypothetical protein